MATNKLKEGLKTYISENQGKAEHQKKKSHIMEFFLTFADKFFACEPSIFFHWLSQANYRKITGNYTYMYVN